MDTVKAKVGSLFSVNLSLIAIFFFFLLLLLLGVTGELTVKHMAMSLKGTSRGTTACEGVERADLVYQQRTGCPSNRFIALLLIVLRDGSIYIPDKERPFLVV